MVSKAETKFYLIGTRVTLLYRYSKYSVVPLNLCLSRINPFKLVPEKRGKNSTLAPDPASLKGRSLAR
jgi:hypothetical protein